MTTRAILDGVVIAEAERVVSLEGNSYFPTDSINWEHLVETDVTSRCFWKGKASYFNATIHGRTYESVGWTYHTPSRAASDIAEHVAFWNDVRIESSP